MIPLECYSFKALSSANFLPTSWPNITTFGPENHSTTQIFSGQESPTPTGARLCSQPSISLFQFEQLKADENC